MDTIYDRNLVARILLTLVTLGYSLPLIMADLNKTHATNPLWTGHARFHVVWQVLSYIGLTFIGLTLIWIHGPLYIERLYLAGGVAAVVYGAFFIALLTMRVYGGKRYDENGYLPFRVRILGLTQLWDVNVTVYASIVVVLIAGVTLISSTK